MDALTSSRQALRSGMLQESAVAAWAAGEPASLLWPWLDDGSRAMDIVRRDDFATAVEITVA